MCCYDKTGDSECWSFEINFQQKGGLMPNSREELSLRYAASMPHQYAIR